MSKKGKKNETKVVKETDFDEDINNLTDWQDHQYDPGHYIGTGRIPRPISGLGMRTIFLMVLGSIYLIFGIVALVTTKEFSIATVIILLLATLFLYRGVYNIRQKNKRK